MVWLIGAPVACVALAGAVWLLRFAGPRVPEERIAPEDQDLVRDSDRARWRRLPMRTYQSWKRHDDFYRIAAYRKLVAGGMSEQDAKARVWREFPIYYLDPATRNTEGFAGDDGALPVVVRERVDRGARVLKELMAEKDGAYRTMNALVRVCFRKGAF